MADRSQRERVQDDHSNHQTRLGDSLPGKTNRTPVLWGLFGMAFGICVALGAGLVVGGPLIVAHRQDLPFELAYGHYAVKAAARLLGGNTANPDASNFRAASAGRAAYTGSCSECHGANGNGKGVFGTQTYPPATDLTSKDAKELTDSQMFWIIKNGLSFTGMPGFAGQYNNSDIWAMVTYVRQLQKGQASPANVPKTTNAQLMLANPNGDAAQRGAAVYFAQGCADCHGATGNAPGELGLRGGGREATRAVRSGRRGMPAYGPDQISNSQLSDLAAYMDTFTGNRGGFGGGRGGDGG